MRERARPGARSATGSASRRRRSTATIAATLASTPSQFAAKATTEFSKVFRLMTSSTYRSDVDQGRSAKHQHAHEQRGAHRRCRRPCRRRRFGRRRRLLDAVRQAPTRYDGVARCGPEGPPSAPREAARHRGAPLSTGSPAAAAAACAATRAAVKPVRRRPVGPARAPPWVGRRARPPAAPSAPRGSGGTTRVAARAHSTECRTGSTPGSPDQPSRGPLSGRGEAGPSRAGRARA